MQTAFDRPYGFYRGERDSVAARTLSVVITEPAPPSRLTAPLFKVMQTRSVETEAHIWVVVPLYNNIESYRTWLEAWRKMPGLDNVDILTVDLSSKLASWGH